MTQQQFVAEWPLWSTTVRVVVRTSHVLGPARAAVEETLEAVDRVANRFDSDSEVSRLAGRELLDHPVSPLLRMVLEQSLRVARLTEGAVDPTVGQALVALGYDREVAGTGPQVRPWTVRAAASWRDVRLAGDRLTVPEGVRLDLGAVGKALAVDLAAEAATQATREPVLVAIGGDLRACGPTPAPWHVEVAEEPTGRGCAWVHVTEGGVATSTTTTRAWSSPRGDRLHHVLDPETGRPASVHWRTATVAAATCVDANAASTASLVKGSAAEGWLRRTGLPARLVHRDGEVRVVNGWPAEDAA